MPCSSEWWSSSRASFCCVAAESANGAEAARDPYLPFLGMGEALHCVALALAFLASIGTLRSLGTDVTLVPCAFCFTRSLVSLS